LPFDTVSENGAWEVHVKKIALGALLALAAAVPAQAADIPARVVSKAPVVVLYNWSGFYIGGNIGYSWGRSGTDATLGSTTGTVFGTGFGSADLDGWIGGGQIGFNWQTGNTVFGLEADIQATGQKGSTTGSCAAGVCAFPALTGTLDQKLDWLATFRARLGWTFTPTTLLYITGGAALGEVKSDATVTGALVTNTASFSNSKWGWTIGAGIEAALGASNWTGKIEYLYVDLGSANNTLTTTIAALPAGFVVLNANSRVTDHIFRVGLNYRFGR
jgi:outer membrane immunogenic protein